MEKNKVTEEKLISFIIPVYNTDIYQLDKCLKSIQQLKNINYEIIIVNDGSNLKNTKMYLKLIKNYMHIRYYEQKNKGVSVARNVGIENSKGKYLCFVDADDEIRINAIKNLNLKQNLDLIIFDVKVIYIDYINSVNPWVRKSSIICLPIKNAGEVSGKDLMQFTLKDGLLNWVFGKLYLRSFLIKHNLKFDSMKMVGEDLDFVTKVISCSPKAYYIHTIFSIYKNSFITGNKRIKDNPIVNLNNELELYYIRSRINRLLNLDKEQEIKKEAVNSIFRICSLFLYYDYKKAIKNINLFIKAIDEIDNNNLLKSRLILHKRYRIILSYYYLREFTHKLKKI